ncbi:hypothetical protein [Clostridium butyricum]|uniref:hypothetical protein n=1 Tax=Clostridium butyricum TaxID=1492 RepID=UPI0002CB125C|nr:hypothetical protein [Clostridium butyricum]EMU52157.1 hypothetical protein CBDKU1_39210 [Clostridium butyricum DKU-01]
MNNFNLLIVDDDESLYPQYKFAIEMVQDEHKDINIFYKTAKTSDLGICALNEHEFDAAIIDLRLSATEDKNNNGNIIIREIKNKMKLPVIVLSGFTEDLDCDLRDTNEFFKVYKRAEKETSEILQELISIYKLGITRIFKNKGLINSYLNEIFWKYISNNLSNLKNVTSNSEQQEKILLRFVVMHLQQYLDLDDDFSFENYHTSEMYIVPPIRKKLFTGDIIINSSEGKYFIVLSPPCDLATKNIKQITIVEIEDIKELEQLKILNSKLKKAKTKGNNTEILEDQINALLSNSSTLKYHFLPPSYSFKGGFINFQKVHSLLRTEIVDNYDRVASVSDAFIKDIIARFSHYYSRQGQPSFNNMEDIFKLITK